MSYDLKITGGLIVDGTGTPGFRGDVGIKDGRIVALGVAGEAAAQTIDAAGRVVAPGFIDLHTHYDFQVLWDPMLSISSWHGVTTAIIGNCGFGIAPTRPEHRDLMIRTLESVEGMSSAALRAGAGDRWPFETFPEYLDAVDRRGIGINLGAFIGHTPVRMYVMGEAATERPATADETARMRGIVAEGLAAGAVGFATSKSPQHVGYEGRPVPSRLAELDEIKALAGTLGDARHGLMMATIGPGLFFKEFEQIARETGRPVCWSALLAGMKGPGSHRSYLERVEAQQNAGFEIFPQVICRPIKFEMSLDDPFLMEILETFKPISKATNQEKKRIYADPAFRDRFNAEVGDGGLPPFGTPWAQSVIAFCPAEPPLEGRVLAEVAAERGVDAFGLMLDLSLATDLEARFRLPVVNTDEDEVEELLMHPGTVLGLSDAGAHASQLCDACFATDLLARWVREKRTIPLEDAVRMLTSHPAEKYGITDRGRLAQGWPADVTIFDPETVGVGQLRRVNDLPAGAERLVADAIGIDAVICNGTVIRRDGKDAIVTGGRLPGRVLRHGAAPVSGRC